MPYRRVGYAEQIWYIFHYKFMEVMHMPRKPKKPCSYPGCPELTDGRYCEKHQKQENAHYEKYDRDSAVRRMTPTTSHFLDALEIRHKQNQQQMADAISFASYRK